MYRKFDFIIYDATNLVGYYCIKNFLKLNSDLIKKYSFAIAGKNKKELKKILNNFTKEFKNEAPHVGIVIVDKNVKESIKLMTQKCKVIISVNDISEDDEVIINCIETYTHYVDNCKDPKFSELMQLKYFTMAKSKKLYLVSSCGISSIPADLGIIDLKEKNPDVEFTFFESYLHVDNSKSFYLNFEILNSLYDFKNLYNQSSEIQNKLYSKLFVRRPVKEINKNSKIIPFLSFKSLENNFYVPFFQVNNRLIKRSQYLFYQENIEDVPSTFAEYLNIPWNFNLIPLIYSLIVIFIMSLFSITFCFLKINPSIFTFGYVIKGDPSKKKIENESFELTLIGKGFKKKNKKEVKKCLKIKGPELVYNTTSIFLINSAITVLKDLEESKKINCGFITPGYAFKNTNFIKRLESFGIEWKDFKL